MTQFGRKIMVRVGSPQGRGREWSQDLRIVATVSAGDRTQPNKLSVGIYNLSDDSEGFLHTKGLHCEVLAGYQSTALLASGTVRDVFTTWEGPDRLTTLEVSDGSSPDGSHGASKRLRISEASGAYTDDLWLKVANEAGFDIGALNAENLALPGGFAYAGSAREALDALGSTTGTKWHVQNNKLIVLPTGAALAAKALLLKADSGLIGIPQRTDKGIKFECLLNPNIVPRRRVLIESREISGLYIVRSYTHQADSHGQAWTTTAEAERG